MCGVIPAAALSIAQSREANMARCAAIFSFALNVVMIGNNFPHLHLNLNCVASEGCSFSAKQNDMDHCDGSAAADSGESTNKNDFTCDASCAASRAAFQLLRKPNR